MRLFFLATIILTSTVHPSTHDHKAKQEPKPVESAGIVHGVNTHIGIKYFTDHYEDENEAMQNPAEKTIFPDRITFRGTGRKEDQY